MASRHRAPSLGRGWRWALAMTFDLALFAAATVAAGWTLAHP